MSVSQIPEEIRTKLKALLPQKGFAGQVNDFKFASGGCINSAGILTTDTGRLFIKWNRESHFPGMFEAEFNGLNILRSAAEVVVPEPFFWDSVHDYGFIIMEYLSSENRKPGYWEKLGTSLARLHKHSSDAYGLDHNNYIGSLPQYNAFCPTWTQFFIEQRLEIQFRLGLQSGKFTDSDRRDLDNLSRHLEGIFPDEPPALLHGDLWGGNVMADQNGNPAIIDPAVFYGNREAEIAFTRMFGGFDRGFYEAYDSVWPLKEGFENRIEVYNLYPLMVHANLFGGGYIFQVQTVLRSFR